MTEVFENPFNDTLRLHYERMTSSSEGFDQEMQKMVDFLFKGLISPEQRAKALSAIQLADLNRLPGSSGDHQNDPACEEQVRKYVPSMPAELLGSYVNFQQRLGYSPG